MEHAPALESSLSVLIWWPLVEVLEAYDDRFKKDFDCDGSSRFPDGTVWLEEVEVRHRVRTRLRTYLEGGLEVEQTTMFRSLAQFEPQGFQLFITGEYFIRIGGEQSVLVTPTRFNIEVDPNELRGSDLCVQVRFWRKPSKQIQADFVDAMIEWERSVLADRSLGGPVKFHRESIRFEWRYATFTIDVSASSQVSVTWLVLSALNFGARNAETCEVLFAWLRDPAVEAKRR